MKRIFAVLAVGFLAAIAGITCSPPAKAADTQNAPCNGDTPTKEYLQSIYHGYAGTLPAGRMGITDDAQKSYVVITYNALTQKTYWSDYPGTTHGVGQEILLTGQSSFTPILYSRERILVRVCGLHFGGTVTTTPTSLSLVDNGFDIRSATLSPQPQEGMLGAPVIPGAGGPPPPGMSDLAPQAAAYHREFDFLNKELGLLQISASHDAGLSIAQELANINAALDAQTSAVDSKMNVTKFNQLLAKVQQASADVAGLQTNLTTLETNISKTLMTDYTALQTAVATEKAKDATDLVAVQTANNELQSAATPADIAKAKADQATAPDIVKAATARQLARRQDLTALGAAGQSVETISASEQPGVLLGALTDIRVGTPGTYTLLGQAFQKINALHDNSDVTYISVITPLVGNGIESIDISVQDSYSPLTLATLSIYGTPPTVPAPNASATPAPSGTIQAVMSKGGGKGGGGVAGGPQTTANTAGTPTPTPTPGPTSPSPGNPAPTTPQTTGGSGAVQDTSVRIEVHRIANFNILAGFAVAHIPVRAYSAVTVPTAVTGGPAAGTYAITTQNDSWQTYGIAGIAWYPGGRDMYSAATTPRDQTGVVGTQKSRWLIPNIVGGSSITSLGTAVFGPSLEPKPGISILLLGVWGATSKLAPGLIPCASLATCPSSAASQFPFTTVPTVSSHTLGLSFGIALDPSVWSLFKPSGP